MGIFYSIFLFAFCASGLALIILVLLRKSDVGGLSGAFGGMGDTAFGVKTQKHLDKIITWVAIFFFFTAILLNLPKFRPHAEATIPGEDVKTEAPAK